MREVSSNQGLTLEECAHKLGLSRQAYHNWLNGKDLKMSAIIRFMEVFNEPFSEIFTLKTSYFLRADEKLEENGTLISEPEGFYEKGLASELLNNYRERIIELKELVALQKELNKSLQEKLKNR